MSGDRCADCGLTKATAENEGTVEPKCWQAWTRATHDVLDCSRRTVTKLRAEVEALRGERDAARACAREHIDEVEARLRDQRNEARTALAAAQKRIEGLEEDLLNARALAKAAIEQLAALAPKEPRAAPPASGVPAPAQQSGSREASAMREENTRLRLLVRETVEPKAGQLFDSHAMNLLMQAARDYTDGKSYPEEFVSEVVEAVRRGPRPASDKNTNRQPSGESSAMREALEAFVALHAKDCCSGADSEYPDDCDECAAAKLALAAKGGTP
jgi:hypothetical protein